MNTFSYSTTRLMRAVRLGTALSAAIFAASALQAQYTGPAAPPPPVSGQGNGVSHAAREFMQEAAQANQTEIAMATIAEARSQNSAVKELAQMMRADHQKNYDLLQAMAHNHLVVLDPALNVMNHRAVHHLQKASEADFDKDYAKVMLRDHVKCIARFDKAIAEINEPYVRQYARDTLPALRKHLRQSEDTARAVGVEQATISAILKGLPPEEALRAIAFNRN